MGDEWFQFHDSWEVRSRHLQFNWLMHLKILDTAKGTDTPRAPGISGQDVTTFFTQNPRALPVKFEDFHSLNLCRNPVR
jgi:hypothetical protein